MNKVHAEQAVQGTFFEYQCSKRKCGKTYWVKAHGPIDGMWSFGSSADFCDHCNKGGPKRTGRIRVDGKIGSCEEPLEVVETTKTYDVEAHVWCGGMSHFLWEVGAKEGHQPNPFDGLTKLKGKGGRLRITMKVEVLKAGQETKPFHLKGCLCCNTHEAAKGKMHIALRDGSFTDRYMENGSGVFCGLKGVPRVWPEGNNWVSPTPGRLERADCKACLEAYAQHEKSGAAAAKTN